MTVLYGLPQLLSGVGGGRACVLAKGNRQPLKADVFFALFKSKEGSEVEH